jgi:hypothetical protein
VRRNGVEIESADGDLTFRATNEHGAFRKLVGLINEANERAGLGGAAGNPSAHYNAWKHDKEFHDALSDATAYAIQIHVRQKRKGTRNPYIGHLFGTASIVIDAGGDKDEAVAALLHDTAEDSDRKPGEQVLREIDERFGARVAGIVSHLSDTIEDPKPAWKPRKAAYLESLKSCADPSVYLVSAADKLYNIRSIADDYATLAEALWSRFSAPNGFEDIYWYYESLAEIYDTGPKDDRRMHIVAGIKRSLERIRNQHNLRALGFSQ